MIHVLYGYCISDLWCNTKCLTLFISQVTDQLLFEESYTIYRLINFTVIHKIHLNIDF